MRTFKNNGDPDKVESRRPPSEREQAILDYLNETDTYKRRRKKIRFPKVLRVEDYGTGTLLPFTDPYGPGFVREKKRTTEDILGFLKNYYENPGFFGYSTGREAVLPKTAGLSTDYEEIIHGGQAPSMFKLDKTFGKKVGKKKRDFLKVASEAFEGTGLESALDALKGYQGGFRFPNIEAEAKPMALKLAMRDYGVIDDYNISDSDLDNINEWYKSNRAEQMDPFSYLFHSRVLENPEYRSALVNYLNSF